MRKEMSPRQREVYDFIVSTMQEKGFPPTLAEMMDHFGFASPTGIMNHLKGLEKKGYIKRLMGKSRGITICDYVGKAFYSEAREFKEMKEIPVVGKIQAGQPLLAIENIQGAISLPAELVKSNNAFALEVQGESMIEAGILPGDLIIARQQESAENGDVVVALIGDEATVKRYFRKDNRITLKPANSRLKPIINEGGDFLIQGKVICLYRVYEK